MAQHASVETGPVEATEAEEAPLSPLITQTASEADPTHVPLYAAASQQKEQGATAPVRKKPAGPPAGPGDVATYNLLGGLEKESDRRSDELRDALVYRIAKRRQSQKNLTDEETAAFAGFMRGKITVAVAYAVDQDGNLIKLVSTNQGKHGMIIPLAPDEQWVGAAPRSGGPKAAKAPKAEKAKAAIPPPVDHAPPAGATTTAPPAEATAATPASTKTRTKEQAYRDAEANIVAEAGAKGWHLVTAGASSSICPHCAGRLSGAGGTTASVRRADPANAPVQANITPAMEALERSKHAPKPPSSAAGSGGAPATVETKAAPQPEASATVPAVPTAAVPAVAAPAPGAIAAPTAPVVSESAAGQPSPPPTPAVTTETETKATFAGVEQTTSQITEGPAGSTTESTARKVSWQGASTSSEKVVKVGEQGTKTGATTEISREGGALTLGHSTSEAKGQLDEDDELIRGTERKQSVAGGIIAGPGGVGGLVKGGAEQTTAYGEGLTTTKSFGADARVVVDAKPVEDSSPLRYQVTTSITLAAKAGLKAGAGTKATGTLGIEAAGSVSWSYTHQFSAEETNRYLGVYAANGAGGAAKEWRVVQLAASGELDEARQLLELDRSSALAAGGAAALAEGDVVSTTVSGSLGASAGLASASKKLPISAEVSLSRSGTLRRTVARKEGKVVVTIEVLGETTGTGGLSASYAGVSAGATATRTESTGRSVSVQLDPAAASYRDQFERIIAADSAAELDELASAPGAVVVADSRSAGWSTEFAPKAGIAGLEATLTEQHAFGETVSTGPEGRTVEVTGSSGAGLKVGVEKGPAISGSTTQQVKSTVGPDESATGELSTTTSETDISSSLQALSTGLEEKPLGTVLGLVTGGTTVLQQRTEATGMNLSDADYTTIYEVARDRPPDWDRAFIGRGLTRNFSEWQALRRRIVASLGDRETMGRVMAEFASKYLGAAEATQAVIRPRGRIEGGIRFDWPPGMEIQQKVFDRLVIGNRLDVIGAKAGSGRFEEALADFDAAGAELNALADTLRRRQEEFSDAPAVAEMLRRIGDRQDRVRTEIRALRKALAPDEESVGGPQGKTSAALAQTRQDEAQLAAERSSRIQDLSRAALTLRDRETAMMAAIRRELDDPPWYRTPDLVWVFGRMEEIRKLHLQWDAIIEQLRAAFSAAGKDPARADQFLPDRKTLEELRHHRAITKYGMVR